MSSLPGETEMPAIALLIIVLVILLVASGFSRVGLERAAGIEGIEDRASAEAYDRISRWPQFRFIRRMIAWRLARYGPKGILADIGCGPGRLTLLIAQKYANLHVLGVDTADEMIRAATANAASLGLSERVEFRKGGVSQLPLEDGALDFAVSTLSLHHWSDPGQGLAEVHRALQVGGQLLLFDMRRDSRRFFYWLMRFAQGVVVPAALRHINEPLGSLLSSYTLDEFRTILGQSPFKEWKIDEGAGWIFVWARKG